MYSAMYIHILSALTSAELDVPFECSVHTITYSLDGPQVQGAAAEDGTVGSAFWVLGGYLQPFHQSLQRP